MPQKRAAQTAMPQRDPAAQPLVEALTRRERDILALLAQGQSAAEIAEHLTLAVSSVRWYLRQVYGKLGVNRKRQAVLRARELGLLDAPAAPAVAGPAPSARKHNLPTQVTRFFGRESEIAQLAKRLRQHRLVTLTGPGGVGKTRLSLQVAEAVLPDYADGAWLVELAGLADPALLPRHAAAALGVAEHPGRPPLESLTLFLRDRQILLILDNCEHLLAACAALAEALLHAAPGLKVLATSREPLGIAGEAVYAVRSLPFPDPAHLPPAEQLLEYTAVRLFVDRAQLVLPEYDVNDSNAAALARICQRLDGIPLAIEMAAARVGLLSTAELAARLEDAFHLLTGGSRTALPRQQTLRATIDWSYNLLSGAERVLLQRLSVFAGGWDLAAAEAVCADEASSPPHVAGGFIPPQPTPPPSITAANMLDTLSALVSKSMVLADRRAGEQTHYRLLETVRQYAREKLDAAHESQRLQAAHLRYFLQLAQAAEPELHGPQEIAWLDRLEAQLDNMRAALAFSQASPAEDDAAAGLRLAADLTRYWIIRGHAREAHGWLEAALARGRGLGQSLLRARVLHAAALLGYEAQVPLRAAAYTSAEAHMARAEAQAVESAHLYRAAGLDGRHGLAHALITLGDFAHSHGEYAPKAAYLAESLALFDALDDTWGRALALRKLADTLDPLVNYLPRGPNDEFPPLPDLPPAARNDHTAELAMYTESLDLFRALGDRWGQCDDLGTLGLICFLVGQYAAGRARFDELIAIQREFGDRSGLAQSLWHLGRAALAEDDLEGAARLFAESLDLRRAMHEFDDPGASLLDVEMARRRGQWERAEQIAAEVGDWSRKTGHPDKNATALLLQGRVARSRGEAALAHARQQDALRLYRRMGHPIHLAFAFHELALLAAARDDQAEAAARLLGAARPYHPALLCWYAVPPIWRVEHEQALASVRARLGAAAERLMAEGEAMRLAQAYAFALGS